MTMGKISNLLNEKPTKLSQDHNNRLPHTDSNTGRIRDITGGSLFVCCLGFSSFSRATESSVLAVQ